MLRKCAPQQSWNILCGKHDIVLPVMNKEGDPCKGRHNQQYAINTCEHGHSYMYPYRYLARLQIAACIDFSRLWLGWSPT